jgi:hypothetical protein
VFSSPSTLRAAIARCFFNWSHPSCPSLSCRAAGAPRAVADRRGSSPPLERHRLSATESAHCQRPSPVSSVPHDRAPRHPLTALVLAPLSPPHLVHRRAWADRAIATALRPVTARVSASHRLGRPGQFRSWARSSSRGLGPRLAQYCVPIFSFFIFFYNSRNLYMFLKFIENLIKLRKI